MSGARDEADLVELVATTANQGGHLLIEGGGSRSRVGAPPAEGASRVDLSAFAGVIDYEPTELVLTAGPATPMDEIETLLAANNQMLAFEPPRHAHLCGRPGAVPTLGGALASNAGGPRRLSAGAARDHFLGFRAVSGRGEAFKAGGKVVKNVTGFDLSKIMAGSWGTLAVLTEVSVKVLPRPPFTATLVLSGLDPARACAAMATACGSPAPITGAAHLPDGRTLLRLEGFEPTVKVRIEALRTLLAEFGSAELIDNDASLALWKDVGQVAPLAPAPSVTPLRDAPPPPFRFAHKGGEADLSPPPSFTGEVARSDGGGGRSRDVSSKPTTPLWRISLPAAQAPAYVAGLPPETWMMDWAGNLIWLAADAPPRLTGPDGHAQYWGGAPVTAAPYAADQLSPASLRTSQGLKAAFDPKDVLNRGRLLPPLGAG